MPVYSEVLDDQEIIKIVKNRYLNILVVGCGSCMNESLAYLHDSPIFVKGADGGNIPYSVLTEIERISNMLNREGYRSSYFVLLPHSNTLCQINCDNDICILPIEPDTEIVLAVCCPAGVIGLKPSVGVPVIRITVSKGCLAYGYTDDSDGTRRIVKEHSKALGRIHTT